MKNYKDMELTELKDIAKEKGISVGNCGKSKLIEKLEEVDISDSVFTDNDFESTNADNDSDLKNIEETEKDSKSLIDAVSSIVDDLEESVDDDIHIEEVGLSLDDVIPVKSITFGGLTYKTRSTGAIYRWNQIGSIEYMTVAELNEMNNHKRSYLNAPLVILLDDRAVKKFRLQPVYEKVAQINNLKKVFASDMRTIEATIDRALSVGMRDILISKSRQMIKNKTLVDINIIKKLQEKLKHDLMDLV